MMRGKFIVLLWLICGLLSLSFMTVSPRDEADDKLQAKITKYLELARSGRVSVRPQAAKRLVKMGAPALQRVIEACGPDGEQLADLGAYFVEVLADFDDPKLRQFLWHSLGDLDFPWRGPAARSLAKEPELDEHLAFVLLLEDRLDQVRLAALDGLEQGQWELAMHGNERWDALRIPSIEQRLMLAASSDASDRVRRAAALLLDRTGHHGYLVWLLEDLQRTDTYFRLPLGEQARFAAIRALKKRLGDDFGFIAEDSPASPENAKALIALREAIMARLDGEPPVVPEIWKSTTHGSADVIGLELRSCRVGEFFLRWNRDDVLLVGTGRPQAINLPEGSVARLEKLMGEELNSLGAERYWGEPGCDMEQFRWVDAEGKVQAFLISKGQAEVQNLRPKALGRVARALVASIPTGSDPSLAAEVRTALELLGGEF